MMTNTVEGGPVDEGDVDTIELELSQGQVDALARYAALAEAARAAASHSENFPTLVDAEAAEAAEAAADAMRAELAAATVAAAHAVAASRASPLPAEAAELAAASAPVAPSPPVGSVAPSGPVASPARAAVTAPREAIENELDRTAEMSVAAWRPRPALDSPVGHAIERTTIWPASAASRPATTRTATPAARKRPETPRLVLTKPSPPERRATLAPAPASKEAPAAETAIESADVLPLSTGVGFKSADVSPLPPASSAEASLLSAVTAPTSADASPLPTVANSQSADANPHPAAVTSKSVADFPLPSMAPVVPPAAARAEPTVVPARTAKAKKAATAAASRPRGPVPRAPMAVAIGLAAIAVFSGGVWYISKPAGAPPAMSPSTASAESASATLPVREIVDPSAPAVATDTPVAAEASGSAEIRPRPNVTAVKPPSKAASSKSGSSMAGNSRAGRAPMGSPAAGRAVAGEPVRFRNPFDRAEIFEFPAGTSQAEARDAVAAMLLERGRERHVPAPRKSRATSKSTPSEAARTRIKVARRR